MTLYLHSPKKRVLYVDTVVPSSANWMRTDEIFNVLKTMKETNAHLTIKLHPANNRREVRYYKRIAKEVGLKDYEIIREMDALDVLKLCDICISANSQMAEEAVLLGKVAIITPEPWAVDDVWDLERCGAAIKLKNFDELKGYI